MLLVFGSLILCLVVDLGFSLILEYIGLCHSPSWGNLQLLFVRIPFSLTLSPLLPGLRGHFFTLDPQVPEPLFALLVFSVYFSSNVQNE